jgi:redox-sensitive bicupin YhaK (pirin superfamily)
MDVVRDVRPLGFPWEAPDPFLFCVHHVDAYPAGNDRFGPAASLQGRDIGNDFAGRDGWRMYHGDVVPGFPQHPHRGFETVTVVRRGLIDHSDSLGAAARYGDGDVQWLTAGKGIVHSEMFPLLDRTAPNPLELFQIWLNLSREDKLADPHFTMLWAPTVPRVVSRDEEGHETEVVVIAGALENASPGAPPPRSWARRPDSDVAIWTIRMAAGARWALPAAKPDCHRRLYVFSGAGLTIGDREVRVAHAADLVPHAEAPIENGSETSEMLLLQGRPLRQPVAQYGPFVMTSKAEIEEAVSDYRRTGFGGWPWSTDGPVHGGDRARFARHPDGRIERPAESVAASSQPGGVSIPRA